MAKRVLLVIVLIFILLLLRSQFIHSTRATNYYLQLVWGTSGQKPIGAPFKPVGRKLANRLGHVFRWSNYWEVNCQELKVSSGKPAHAQLSPDCAIEILLVGADKRETRLFGKGVLVQKVFEPAHQTNLSIHGGPAETDGAWFIVVREDRPTYGLAKL